MSLSAKTIEELALNLKDYTISLRRDLHLIPELALELPQTVAYVKGQLDEMGVPYQADFIQGNGIVATIRGLKEASNDKTIALRADMDALPIKEETGLPFSSKNDNMHACGHDGHTAMLLTAVKILMANRQAFSGTVKCIFQPGEEYPGGAKLMVEEGVLEGVDCIYGFHIGQLDPKMTSGQIGFCPGPMMASMDRFLITITGKGNHGAYPEDSRDPIAAGGQLITALQTIKSRNINTLKPCVLSITRVQSGFNQNIIPNTFELEGTVRTFDNQVRHQVHKRMEEIAQGIGLAMSVDCKVDYDYKYPALINDEKAAAFAKSSLAELFPASSLVDLEHPLMSSEDFASYLEKVPGAFLYLSNPREIDGKFHGHHHPQFDIDESKLHLGVQAFVKLALDYLS